MDIGARLLSKDVLHLAETDTGGGLCAGGNVFGWTDFSGSRYVDSGGTALRRGIDGLAAVVQRFQLNPSERNVLFLFCGTRSNRIKGLAFEGDGWLLLYKRLDNGRFRWPRNAQEAISLTQEQFDWLMKGMTIVSTIHSTKPKYLC